MGILHLRRKYFFCLSIFFICACGTETHPLVEDSTLDSGAVAAAEPVHLPSSQSHPALIDGVNYQMFFTFDEFQSDSHPDYPTVTLRIINQNTGDTLNRTTYEGNYVGEFKNPARGKYWFTIGHHWGTSSYRSTCFTISTTNPEPVGVFDSTELGYFVIAGDGNSCLRFEGIWILGNPDDDTFEAHFSEHRQQVTEYHIEQTVVRSDSIGITESKYDFESDSSTFERIQKDPLLKKSKIDWNKYN